MSQDSRAARDAYKRELEYHKTLRLSDERNFLRSDDKDEQHAQQDAELHVDAMRPDRTVFFNKHSESAEQQMLSDAASLKREYRDNCDARTDRINAAQERRFREKCRKIQRAYDAS
jgi:hypothetical protein